MNPLMLENGWTFADDFPDATGDQLYHHQFLYQLYLQGLIRITPAGDRSGAVGIKNNKTIVSNESAGNYPHVQYRV